MYFQKKKKKKKKYHIDTDRSLDITIREHCVS